MKKVSPKIKIRRNRILRLLLDEGNLSLAEISRRTGIGLPMISRLAKYLEDDGFIRLKAGAALERTGRPPVIARLNGNGGYVVGIDLGHRNTNILILNLERKIVAERTMPTRHLMNNMQLVKWLKDSVERMLLDSSITRTKLFGVGLSIPGIVRGREGRSETFLNFGEVPVQQVMQEKFKVPVHIEHDAKAMALGEKWFGAARNIQHALCLNIGWGLGLGILLDGRIFYGRDGFAGEFGHIQLNPQGVLCYCGKRGCLETLASGMAIEREAKSRLAKGAVSKLQHLCKGSFEQLDAAMVVKSAVAGDAFSIELLEEAGRHLGNGLAQLINIFNPEKIILGGRVSQAGQFILNPVKTTAMKSSLIPLGSGIEFTISSLGSKAGALGVAMLATRDIFEVEHLNPTAYV